MPDSGRELRLRRFQDAETGRFVLVPMDHGASAGPLPGLEDPQAAVHAAVRGGATGVVVHKGLVRAVAPALGRAGLLVHLSASTALNPDPDDKRLVGTVEEAVRLGADGVSVHVNVGAPQESRMVEDLGRVATECARLGVPLLAMMYARGHDIRDPHDPGHVAHVARLGAELGADVVKCPYTGSVDSFRAVVRGCPVPVVVSGGARAGTDAQVLELVHGAMQAGAAGVSIGRNAFQHPRPEAMVRAIAGIVLEGQGVEQARKLVR